MYENLKPGVRCVMLPTPYGVESDFGSTCTIISSPHKYLCIQINRSFIAWMCLVSIDGVGPISRGLPIGWPCESLLPLPDDDQRLQFERENEPPVEAVV